jgi:hypothetical protein
MNINGDYLEVVMDDDASIDGRYKYADFKLEKRKDLARLASWVKIEPVSICFHITKYHNEENIHVAIKIGGRFFKKSYQFGSWGVSNDAFAFVKQHGKRSVFTISQFEHVDGCYIAKIRITPIEPIELELLPKCCACYEENKQTSTTGYFQCNHKIICNECYDKLLNICCPYCRAKKK